MLMSKETTTGQMQRDVAGLPTVDFGGRGVRHVRLRNRDDLRRFAQTGPTEFPTLVDSFARLVRDADTLHPRKLAELRTAMDLIEERWHALADDDRASVAEWIESICTPWLVARAPLRANGLSPSWSSQFLLALLSDYDASGQVIRTVDRAWERPSRSASDVATTARLAVAAGWMAWSHLIVDPRLAESSLNVLGEVLDRLDSLAHTGGTFSAADRGWTLAALTLEERLLRHWLPGRGSVH
jgi:hypothetical protein